MGHVKKTRRYKGKEKGLGGFRFRPSFDRWMRLITTLGFSLLRLIPGVSLLTMIRDRYPYCYCRAKHALANNKTLTNYTRCNTALTITKTL